MTLPVWSLVCLVIGARLLFSFFVFPAMTAGSQLLNTVPDDYDKIARNLSQGHGYVLSPGTAPTMQRLPLYPFLLAGSFLVFGEAVWPVQLVHAMIDGVSCVLVFGLASRLFGDRGVSQLAALLFAAYPGFSVAAARIVTEPVYTLLLLLAVTFYQTGRRTGRARPTLAAGLVLGLAALCKSTGLFLPACLGALATPACSTERRLAAVARTTAILSAGMLLALSPWVLRNYRLTARFVPTSTIGGTVLYDSLYMVNNPGTDKELFQLIDLSKQEQYRLLSSHAIETHSSRYPFWFHRSVDEYRWDRLAYRAVIEAVRDAPQKALRMLAANALGFWFFGRTWAGTLLAMTLHVPLLIAATIGLRRAYLEGYTEAWIPVTVIAYFGLVHALTLGMVRYAVPVVPFVLILAAKGMRDLSWGCVVLARACRA